MVKLVIITQNYNNSCFSWIRSALVKCSILPFQIKHSYKIYLSGMKLEFVMKVEGVDIKVQAISLTDCYGGLPHMQLVGSYTFAEVDSGISRGYAGRYNQDCDEIMLLAETRDQIDLAHIALEWIQTHYSYAEREMGWNTAQQGKEEDFQKEKGKK